MIIFHYEIWFKNVFEKKFQSFGWPPVLFIETKFVESIPSLRNLTAIPGIKGVFSAGEAADESLAIPWSDPLKIPVYWCY